MYADDTTIVFDYPSNEEAHEMMLQDVRKLENYFAYHQLTVNIDKTLVVQFSNLQNENMAPIEMYGSQITNTSSSKFLGVHLDRRMTFKTHIEKVRRELSSLLGILHCNRKVLPLTAQVTVYRCLFIPKLCYGIEGYGSATKTAIQPLQIIQNKMLKLLLKLPPRTPSTSLYAQSDIDTLPVRALYVQSVLMLMYKIMNGFVDSNISFTMVQHPYNYRRQGHIKIPKFRLEFGKRKFTVQAAQLWNEVVASKELINFHNLKRTITTRLKNRVAEFLN